MDLTILPTWTLSSGARAVPSDSARGFTSTVRQATREERGGPAFPGCRKGHEFRLSLQFHSQVLICRWVSHSCHPQLKVRAESSET